MHNDSIAAMRKIYGKYTENSQNVFEITERGQIFRVWCVGGIGAWEYLTSSTHGLHPPLLIMKGKSKRKKHAQEGSIPWRWFFIAGLVICLAVVMYYSMTSVDYSGPRFANSERGAQKREERDRKAAAEKTKREKKEENKEVEDTSSCDDLTQGAQRILNTSPLRPPDIDLALDMLATCALKDETASGPKWNLAAALLQINRTREALPFIDEALTLAPTNTDYLYEGGVVMSRLGLYKEAIRCWDKYLEIKLSVSNWDQFLARLSIQREDEWAFLQELDVDVGKFFESLLDAYLRQYSFIKASYLYRILIGLRGLENSQDLIGRYAFYAFSVGDLSNGIGYLQYHTERSYIAIGYGEIDRAREVITAHALRLFTGGIDSSMVAMIRNLLMAGRLAWEELVYHCELKIEEVDVSVNVSLELIREVFSACALSQGIIPKLLERGAVVHAENIFGWTPLLQVVSLDSPSILHQVLKGRADVQSRTAMGLTALHIAAIKGSSSIVLPLVQANLKPHVKDAMNRTALDLACMNRWYAKQFAKALKVSIPPGCPVKPIYLPPLQEGSKTGGWMTSGIALPHDLTNEKCDIEVIGYNARAEELIAGYLTISRPVLIRNASSSQSMKRLYHVWQRSKLEKEYGHIVLNEVAVPYAEAFGYNQTVKTTLRNFLIKMAALREEQAQARDVLDLLPPSYIFQSLSGNSPLFEHFKVPTVLDPSQTEISTEKIQFYVGGALSGAPPHFHRTAWNVLVYGKKRWFIFPPKSAFYSREHVWDWWRNRYRNEASGTRAWECVQYPGDLIVLPDMWGHAVINLQESVGVASEFVYGSSEFSL